MSRARLFAWAAFTLRSRLPSYFSDGPWSLACRAGALNDAQIFQPPAIGARGGSLLTCSRHRRRSTALHLQRNGLLSKPRQHIAASSRVPLKCHSPTVTYPVLYSKKLHHLEPPYGIEP